MVSIGEVQAFYSRLDVTWREMRIDHCHRDVGMSEKLLHSRKIRTLHHKPRRERMP